MELLLHSSAYQGHKEIAELLIDKGADVNAKNSEGLSPLDLAMPGDVEETPKQWAAKKEVANLLRKHGGKTGEELKAEGK
jgi:ankyrin repeat protein